MTNLDDAAKEAAEYASYRTGVIKSLQYARATRGLDEVRIILMEAGCLVPLFDAFVDGVRAARELRDSLPTGLDETGESG